jgi:hypothetical protein
VITHISSTGARLMARGRELFLDYDRFPWFREAPVKLILKVEEPRPGRFHWPDLDVDLTETIIDDPDQFPLIANP